MDILNEISVGVKDTEACHRVGVSKKLSQARKILEKAHHLIVTFSLMKIWP